MKIVIQRNFGSYGWGVTEEFKDFVTHYRYDRTNPELIKLVEEHPDDCGCLIIVEIPDDITDYMIDEYDGLETIIYVSDGKIYTQTR